MRSVGLALSKPALDLLLPGLFAGFIPWRYFGLGEVVIDWRSPRHLLGLAAIGTGVGLLAACIWEFARRGRGTLAPVDPPKELVVQGLYRYVRNPMYLSVTVIVLGEVLLTGSTSLLAYWAVWFLAANLFVIGYEEPTLLRRFGPGYQGYRASVGRWLPRRPARQALFLMLLIPPGGSPPATGQAMQQGPIVHVIAPSASTRREAGRILRLCRWTDTTAVADADRILVIVRSSGSQPMAPSYDNLKWLRDEAQSQLNDSGAQFHIYFYAYTSTGRVLQESHRAYDVPEGSAIPDPSARTQAVLNSGLNCGF